MYYTALTYWFYEHDFYFVNRRQVIHTGTVQTRLHGAWQEADISTAEEPDFPSVKLNEPVTQAKSDCAC